MGLTKNTLSHDQLSDKLEEKKHDELTYLKWRGNTKKHTEKAL